MNRTAAFALGFLITGCSATSSNTTSSAPPPIYPSGVATDAADLRKTTGFFLGDNDCCWLTDAARFVVVAKPGAQKLVLRFYEPTDGPLATFAETVAIGQGQGGTESTVGMKGGRQTVVVPIRADAVSKGSLPVRLTMRKTFVPKDIGLNADVRRLSVIIEGASTR